MTASKELSFRRFDPRACGFPKPVVPVLPPFDRRAFVGSPGADATALRHYAYGRYALRAAFELSGLGPTGTLLAPALHCRTMIDPALALGAAVRLYPLAQDLTPRLDVIGTLLAEGGVRLVLLTHYFGRAQPPELTARLAALCREHGVALVEDCSHALRSGSASRRIGHAGSYGVASPYKFYPCPEGGILWRNDGELPQDDRRGPGVAAELRAGLRLARRWFAGPGATPTPAPAASLSSAAPVVCGEDLVERSGAPSPLYAESEQHRRSLAIARLIVRRSDREHIARLRRRRYDQWREAVARLPHCRALWPDWHDDDVPYMFPLLIDHPDPHFFKLKRLGMPIWRWDDMAMSDCEVASRYRLRLLHLPCHQGLDDSQMDWLVDTLSTVLRMPPSIRDGEGTQR